MTGETPATTSSPPSPDAAATTAPPVTTTSASPPGGAAPAKEAPKIEAKPAESLLGKEPTEPAKEQPAEAVKQPEAKKDAPPEQKTESKPGEQNKEGSQSEAPLPTYESFKLPDGYTADEARLGEFTKDLGEFEKLTKADHAEVQKLGQKLVDKHVAELQTTVQRINEYYQTAFEKQKTDWKDSFEKDPEWGGPRKEATINSALEFIRTHGGSQEQQNEFRQLMNQTGIGNHPALIRLLARANTALKEGSPVPASAPAKAPQSKIERRYGKI